MNHPSFWNYDNPYEKYSEEWFRGELEFHTNNGDDERIKLLLNILKYEEKDLKYKFLEYFL